VIKLNKYGIPIKTEEKVRQRDKHCVYCHVAMKQCISLKGLRSDSATIEHIDNDGSLIDEDNIAICCWACNSSKGTKALLDWFNSPYCKEKNINKETVAPPIKKYGMS
jgi:5-methylcytosine-specific restriction endonuclease McrA